MEIDGKERKRLWDEFPEPKPPWEFFKKMFFELGGDMDEITSRWRKFEKARFLRFKTRSKRRSPLKPPTTAKPLPRGSNAEIIE